MTEELRLEPTFIEWCYKVSGMEPARGISTGCDDDPKKGCGVAAYVGMLETIGEDVPIGTLAAIKQYGNAYVSGFMDGFDSDTICEMNRHENPERYDQGKEDGRAAALQVFCKSRELVTA